MKRDTLGLGRKESQLVFPERGWLVNGPKQLPGAAAAGQSRSILIKGAATPVPFQTPGVHSYHRAAGFLSGRDDDAGEAGPCQGLFRLIREQMGWRR